LLTIPLSQVSRLQSIAGVGQLTRVCGLGENLKSIYAKKLRLDENYPGRERNNLHEKHSKVVKSKKIY